MDLVKGNPEEDNYFGGRWGEGLLDDLLRQLIDGVNRHERDRPFSAAFSAISGVPFSAIGNSMHVPDNGIHRENHHYTQRLVKLADMASLSTRAVGGTMAGRVARNTLREDSVTELGVPTAVPPRAQHYVGACIMGNNMRLGASAANIKTVSFAVRATLSALTADYKVAASTPAFVFSSGWQPFEQAAIAGPWIASMTPGSYVEYNYSGEQGVDLIFTARADLNGLVTFTEGAIVLGTLDTRGVVADDASTPAIFSVRGRGPGVHTIRATVTEGAALFDGALIPSTAPTSGYVLCEMTPDTARYNPNPGLDWLATRDALWSATVAVLEDFPTFRGIQVPLDGWDPVTMTAEGLHPNDQGQDYILRHVMSELADVPYSRGMGNVITTGQTYPAPYAPPAAPAIPAGGTHGGTFG